MSSYIRCDKSTFLQVTSAFFSDVPSCYIMVAILSAVMTSALIYHFTTPYPMTSQTVDI